MYHILIDDMVIPTSSTSYAEQQGHEEDTSISKEFTKAELSLNKSCEALETLIRKSARNNQRLKRAQNLDQPDLVVKLSQKQNTLMTLYKVYYEMCEQQAEELRYLEQVLQEQDDDGETVHQLACSLESSLWRF